MTYQDLKNALAVFGIDQRATWQHVKRRHRELVKQHHPDTGAAGDSTAIQKINAAYALLKAYCTNYRYCFSEEEFLEQVPQERLRRQFSGDPVWSGDDEDA